GGGRRFVRLEDRAAGRALDLLAEQLIGHAQLTVTGRAVGIDRHGRLGVGGVVGQRAGDREQEPQHPTTESEGEQHGADDATDPAGLGLAFAFGVHAAAAHFGQVVVTQDPGNRAEERAGDEAENAQDKDEGPAVRLHVPPPAPRTVQGCFPVIVFVVLLLVLVAPPAHAGGRTEGAARLVPRRGRRRRGSFFHLGGKRRAAGGTLHLFPQQLVGHPQLAVTLGAVDNLRHGTSSPLRPIFAV